MSTDTKRWLREHGENVLREIGISRGQTVLDFGCGSGSYTIPAAYVVGDKGKVYALDKDRKRLDELARRAQLWKLENIEIVETSGELKIPLKNESMDVILLIDIIHDHYFSPTTRKELFHEIYRISKPNTLISVYPKHMELNEARKIVEEANFHFERKVSTMLLHNDSLVNDSLLNFRK